MEFSEKRRHIVVNSHSCRAYTLNEWVEDSGNDDYLALVDKNSPAMGVKSSKRSGRQALKKTCPPAFVPIQHQF